MGPELPFVLEFPDDHADVVSRVVRDLMSGGHVVTHTFQVGTSPDARLKMVLNFGLLRNIMIWPSQPPGRPDAVDPNSPSDGPMWIRTSVAEFTSEAELPPI